MGIIKGFTEALKEQREKLGLTWKKATVTAPVFPHMTEEEQHFFSPVYDDFLNKAQRGWFDEDLQKEFRRILSRYRCDKTEMDHACAYMNNIAMQALPENQERHQRVQDRYWRDTGLTDTRASTPMPEPHND